MSFIVGASCCSTSVTLTMLQLATVYITSFICTVPSPSTTTCRTMESYRSTMPATRDWSDLCSANPCPTNHAEIMLSARSFGSTVLNVPMTARIHVTSRSNCRRMRDALAVLSAIRSFVDRYSEMPSPTSMTSAIALTLTSDVTTVLVIL